jgi:hypothetical protein
MRVFQVKAWADKGCLATLVPAEERGEYDAREPGVGQAQRRGWVNSKHGVRGRRGLTGWARGQARRQR